MSEKKKAAVCPSCEESLAGWKRALADYDNLKKDLAREREQIREALLEREAHDLLPVLDNFDEAVKFTPDSVPNEAKKWLQGILYVRTQLEEVLKRKGFEPYGQVGEAFDPNLHDAAGHRQEADKVVNTILEVVRRGWRQEKKIIRPAKVIINK